MPHKILIIIFLFLCQTALISANGENAERNDSSATIIAAKKDSAAVKTAPPVVHPPIGEEVKFGDSLSIRLEKKLQNYSYGGSQTPDPDVYSPKSVNIHPSGRKFYVNSLEGGKTVVYSLPEAEKIAVINHRFDSDDAPLWAPASGLFRFRHYSSNLNTFMGKPVESTFSHGGRYLWVPYYRRSFDINAQDPSALAVIDTSGDSIIRIMETGVLPKMIATSPDGTTIAVTHWGDNTVSLIDIASDAPSEWKYKALIPVGTQLFHNFSLSVPVDRDSNSGEALRGTVFTPDGRYLLIGCMGGSGGIAVIDLEKEKFIGKLTGGMTNVRHLVINGDWLYASINTAGLVKRAPMAGIMESIAELGNVSAVNGPQWQTAKVAPGARTIALSPQGDYIFAACNSGSMICIVDSSMQKIAEIPADSYPVGLDISPDGQWLISTSQGKHHVGGNCVDIFRLTGIKPLPAEIVETPAEAEATEITAQSEQSEFPTKLVVCIAAVILVLLTGIILRKKKK
ncbi:MAG: beta-propeller fold lactonase family protein [Muribaculaceae bacterium]|nr:beta-propeller fold lactonase family protein [Muribaculaceae bacterium]